MSAITLIHSNETSRPLTAQDSFRKPLYWCGRQWGHLCNLGDGNIAYKTALVALRIIPMALLTVATFFAGALSGVYSVVDSFYNPYYSNSTARENNDALELNIAMDSRLQDRCRELHIDRMRVALLVVNGEIEPSAVSERVRQSLPQGIFGSIYVEGRSHLFPPRVWPDHAISITLGVVPTRIFQNTLILGFKNPNTSYEQAKYPFRNHEALKEVADTILGLNDGSRAPTLLEDACEVNLLVSKNLEHMTLRFIAR